MIQAILAILAIVIGCYLVAGPDPFTLRATRGAVGAIGGAIRPAGSGGRSGGRAGTGSGSDRIGSGGTTRSRGRIRSGSANPRAAGSDPDPIGPIRSRSRVGGAIRSGIRSVDRARARRSDAGAAIRELVARRRARQQTRRDRRQARNLAAAKDAAYDENDRRDRAAKRRRIRDGVKQVADQIDPTKNGEPMSNPYVPVDDLDRLRRLAFGGWAGDGWGVGYNEQHYETIRKNGTPRGIRKQESVSNSPDLTHINLTELAALDDLYAEIGDANHLTGILDIGVRELATFLRNLGERYAAAGDLLKTEQMNSCVALLGERNLDALLVELYKSSEQLELTLRAIAKAKSDVRESDAKTGRVETARAN